MSNRNRLVGWAVVLGMAVAIGVSSSILEGCQPLPKEPLTLTPPWKAGEVSVLSVHKGEGGPVVGQWTMRVAAPAEGGGWVLMSVMEMPEASYLLDTAVHVAAEDLVPIHVDFKLNNKQGTVTYTADYANGKATLSGTVYGKTQTAEIKLPEPPYFDNEQFLMTLRAMSLAEGWHASINDIITSSAFKQRVQVKVVRLEDVTTPAGAFRCWVAELVGASQRAWIAVDPPHQIVKFANDTSQLVSILESYTSGD